jgi:hypothetical protein
MSIIIIFYSIITIMFLFYLSLYVHQHSESVIQYRLIALCLQIIHLLYRKPIMKLDQGAPLSSPFLPLLIVYLVHVVNL